MKFINLNSLKTFVAHKSFLKLLALAFVVVIVIKNLPNHAQSSSNKQTILPIATRLYLSEYTPRIKVSGFLKPGNLGVVKANFKAVVKKVYIKRGRFVKKGEVILELKSDEIERRLDEAKARHFHKLSEHESCKSLAKKLYTSHNDYLAKIADLEQSKANLQKAKTDADELKVTALDDGYLEECFVHEGDTVFAQDKLVNLVYSDFAYVRSYVSEEIIEKLSIGIQVNVKLGEYECSGKVSGLSRVADPTTRSFYVDSIVEVPNNVNYGTTAEVTLVLLQRKGFWINASALTLDDNGVLGIKVLEDSKVVFLPVKLSSMTELGAYIEHDSSELSLIAYGGEFLLPGQSTEVIWQKSPTL
ncbi:MAG: efflux RND transporter periplasmic adaptor subunit [Proteobacteria bacterium]|nr:efflux RND transporter periplasmic adaptor subunit [Pseudomonadota bacterium]